MTFWKQVQDWLGIGAEPEAPPGNSEIYEAIEVAKLAQRSEDYDRALTALDRAMRIADEEKDAASVTIIALHQADVLSILGDYEEAEQLLRTVQQTAEAVNQPGFMSYALSSLGVLHQRKGEWDEARQVFERARDIAVEAGSIGAEGRALGHLADVYLHENNASYAIHLLQESLPKLNAAGDLELSSYFVGRLGEAMLDSGQDEEGYQFLDRALKLGEQLRNTRMVRRWSVAMGHALFNQQRYQEAYMFYKQALPLFKATPTVDYITALIRVSRTCLSMGEREEALVYARQALQVSEQGDDATLQAKAQGALGVTLRANGENAEAVEHLRVAVESRVNDDDALVGMWRQLAAAQAGADMPEQAATSYARARELAQQLDEELALAEVHRDIGLLYTAQGKLTEAIQEWSAALSIFESASEYAQLARLHCDIASARRQLGQGQRAIRDYEQALITLNNVDDIATRGLVLSNAANAYADQGDVESAAAFFQEAIDIARKIGDKTAQSTRQGNYGWFLVSTGKPRQAIEQLTAALKLSQELDLTLQSAVQTDNLGLAYDGLSQYKTALEQHEKAHDLLAMLPKPPARWQAIFKVNTAKTKLALGQVDEAAALVDEALELARAANDYEALASALVGKARVLLRQSQPQNAQPVVAEGLQIARKADLRRLSAEAMAVYSEQQAAVQNDEKAREMWEEAKRVYRMVGSPQAKQTPFWLGTDPPPSDTE